MTAHEIFKKLRNQLVLSFKDIEPSSNTIFIFGIFNLVHHPLIYFLGSPEWQPSPMEMIIRASIVLLCLPFCFVYQFSNKRSHLLNIYWFLVISYALPFFAVFMFIEYNGAQPWPTKVAVALLWLVLITNWRQFITSIILAALVAIFIQKFFLNFNFTTSSMSSSEIINALWIIIIAAVFTRRKEVIQQERQRTLQMQAGAIAHEMRTPLFSLSGIGHELKEVLPVLIHAYEEQGPATNKKHLLNQTDLRSIHELPQEIEQITRQAFSFINMMLINLREDFKDAANELCSIKTCVEDALKEYPFFPKDRELLHIQLDEDFEFKGNPLLIKHLFFNLLKNSIYYVKAANKGGITLRTYTLDGLNTLSFKDTGAGIAPDILPHIFDKFYSRTKYGTGIGLAFCKAVMKSLGGDIRCTSQFGEYTEFILTFPPLVKA